MPNHPDLEATRWPHESPTPEQQRAVSGELRKYFAKIDEKTTDVSDTEQQEIFDEAMRSVRPNYRSIR